MSKVKIDEKTSENVNEKKITEVMANKIGTKDIFIIAVKKGFHSSLRNLKESVIMVPKSLSFLNSIKSFVGILWMGFS